jgi:hypothetical protein
MELPQVRLRREELGLHCTSELSNAQLTCIQRVFFRFLIIIVWSIHASYQVGKIRSGWV